MDRSTQRPRNPAAPLVIALFACLIGAVRVWQSPAPSEASDFTAVSGTEEVADSRLDTPTDRLRQPIDRPSGQAELKWRAPSEVLNVETPAPSASASRPVSRDVDPGTLRLLLNNRADTLYPNAEWASPLPAAHPATTPPQSVDHVRVPAPVLAPEVAFYWPVPEALIAEIEQLSTPRAAEWKQRTIGWLRTFKSIRYDDHAGLQRSVEQLEQLSRHAEVLANHVESQEDAATLRMLSYALARRVQLWNSVLRATAPQADARARQISNLDARLLMRQALATAQEAINKSSHEEAWTEFLTLDRLGALANSSEGMDPDARVMAAGIALDRMLDQELSEPQRMFLNQPALRSLQDTLHVWSTRPLDGAHLLQTVERLEQQSSADHSAAVAAHWQRLRYSKVDEHRQLASVIDGHYRNANIRFAATEAFLNRLLPVIQNARQPIREVILGAEVMGQGASRTELQVDLLPDDTRIKAELRAQGHLNAQTQSRAGPIVFHNRNRSQYLIRKLLTLDGTSVRMGESNAVANARTNLLGLNTRYDTFPIVGGIVRRMAVQRHMESKGAARRILEDKVAGKARQQIDMEVSQKVATARQRLEEAVLEPLEAMELAPTTLAMSSTDHRMEMRGRLAADHQLGAFTARPRPVADNLVDMQIHQSAINNFLAQIQLEGREGLLPDVFRGIATDLGFGDLALPEEMPTDVWIRLADDEPIRVDCEDDRVQLTLRIDTLRDGDRDWEDFEVVAFYAPQVRGISCDLHREEAIQVSCRSMRDRFPVRAIFTKVLSKNQSIPIVHPELAQDPRMKDLQLSQFVLRQGWIGLTVGPAPTATPPTTAHSTSPMHR